MGVVLIRGESGVSPPFPLIKKTMNYQKAWNTMNDLEMVTSKIVSAREILDSAIDRLEEHQYDKAGTLLYAVDEFLQYYLAEFDTKFKDAWKETVTKLNQETIKIDDLRRSWDSPEMWDRLDDCANVAPSATQRDNDDCMPPWGHSDMEALRYTDKEMDAMCDNAAKQDKVVKWRLPIEEVENGDTGETEYFITVPDDLLEAANLEVNDEVEWVDRNDGSFLIRKIEKEYEHSSHYYDCDRNKTPVFYHSV
jgi:hypothetical protein